MQDFLENFRGVANDETGTLISVNKYLAQLVSYLAVVHSHKSSFINSSVVQQEIANRKRETLDVDLDDLAEYVADDFDSLIEFVESNTLQYVQMFAQAADAAMPEATIAELPEDVFDVMLEQRRRAQELTRAQAESEGRPAPEANDPSFDIPASLTRRYHVILHPRKKSPRCKLRGISAVNIGGLVTFKGIVTQVTDVRPQLTVATYLDDESGFEIYQEVNGRTFNPLAQAPPKMGDHTGSKGHTDLHMQVRGSKFVRYQEAKVQESPDEVPQGSTPRSMTIHLRGTLTRSVKAGDAIELTGIFLPEPFSGGRGRGRATLLTSTYVHAMHIVREKQSYSDMSLSGDQMRAIENLIEDGDVYSRLASSIAPEIYGHEDVKRALLLALVGGVNRTLPDGMKLRGDVHLCLMGDPGVAKSQLLRYVAHISPRAVYTTGKGSSGVGLTAAVLRDPTTNEMVLEGGALVMADKGICCIDEFDKMEEGDRTAIHEVMEQQTVSIAKAGITTTLNTRTTVLAAANPAFGRYDIRRSPAENINLPAALLSRFDLLWLILDKPSIDGDLSLAQHVLAVHRDGAAPAPQNASQAPLSPELLRAYIAAAKSHDPYVPLALSDYIAAVYAEMRAEEAAAALPHSYTTARTLLSILRLSQALARLRFADHIEQNDVDEALRLMKMSKSSLYDENNAERALDPISRIFARIRQHAERTQSMRLTWADISDLLGTSFKPEQIRQCLVDYASINVWQLEGIETETPAVVLAAA